MNKLVLLLIISIAAWGVSSVFFSPLQGSIDLERGRADFKNHCARCHALGEEKGGLGPSLHAIGELAGSRVPGQSAAQYLWTSVISPNAFRAADGMMPDNLVSAIGVERMRDVLGYIAISSGAHDLRELAKPPKEASQQVRDRKPVKLELVSIEEGRRLFHGKFKCASCHKLNPAHDADNLSAPSLAGAGLLSRDYLIQSIREPSAEITAGYRAARCIIDDEVVMGRLLGAPQGNWTLLAQAEDGWSIFSATNDRDRMDSDLKMSDVSLMPAFDQQTMSDEELESLLQFLQTLR